MACGGRPSRVPMRDPDSQEIDETGSFRTSHTSAPRDSPIHNHPFNRPFQRERHHPIKKFLLAISNHFFCLILLSQIVILIGVFAPPVEDPRKGVLLSDNDFLDSWDLFQGKTNKNVVVNNYIIFIFFFRRSKHDDCRRSRQTSQSNDCRVPIVSQTKAGKGTKCREKYTKPKRWGRLLYRLWRTKYVYRLWRTNSNSIHNPSNDDFLFFFFFNPPNCNCNCNSHKSVILGI